MVRAFLLFASIFIQIFSLKASPPGAAIVHFDKSFYVSGEVVWYKLYLPATAQGKDFSVKVIVLGGPGQAKESFLPVEKKGVCQGYFLIPFDALASVYTFRFSATRADGTEDELIRAYVPVYNDLNVSLEKITVQPFLVEDKVIMPNDLNVSIQLVSDAVPAPRQNLQIKINVTDQLGNPVSAEGSISITDEVLCGGKVFPKGNFQIGTVVYEKADWLSGVYKKGIVRHADGRLMSSTLIPLLDIETHQLHFTKSSNGAFTMALPAYTGNRHLQMVGLQEEPLKVTWEDYEDNPSQGPSLTYTEGILHYLDLSRKRKKVYQLFGQTETALNLSSPVVKPVEWKGKQFYKVQNYERFPDLATFFQEVIWRVKFSKKGDRFTAKMYNVDTHADFEEAPLFLIDQKASFDADFIARLDPAGIQSIELLFEPKLLRKFYPAIGGGGVVRIKTLAGNQKLPSEKEPELLNLQGQLLPAMFPSPSPEGQPHLRPVIYWQPSFSTDKTGAVTIPFAHTEDRSTFCAEIMVQGPDGRRGYARFCYKVD
ncbi:MAG: hypothetical protein ACKVU0_06615 [Saprospiraceae bacterium]